MNSSRTRSIFGRPSTWPSNADASIDAVWEELSHPERTGEYLETFQRVDAFLELTPNETLSRGGLQDKQHAIVVLGAMLETNGVIKLKLIGRLRQALKLAHAYPAAPIILTGGNQKGVQARKSPRRRL